MIRRALVEGLNLLLRHKKAVLALYMVNLGLLLVLVMPFMGVLEDSLGSGIYGEKLIRDLDYDWLNLFRERAKGAASTFSPTVTGLGPWFKSQESLLDGGLLSLPIEILVMAAVYLLINSYLTGAALGSMVMDPRGTTVKEFFRTGGEFFGRFFRLSLLSVCLFWFLYSWVVNPVRILVEDLTREASVDTTIFLWKLATYIATMLLFLVVNLVLDYAKIVTVAGDRTSILLAAASGVSFVFGNFQKTVTLYVTIGFFGVVAICLVSFLEGGLPQTTAFGILAAFAVQQIYVFLRLGLRLYFYSSETKLFIQIGA
jgi:hypothetical protein